MKKPIQSGDIVAVDFLDHMEDGDEPLQFTVYGKVVESTDVFLRIVSWEYTLDSKDKNPCNEKLWVIVRSAITRTRKLKPT